MSTTEQKIQPGPPRTVEVRVVIPARPQRARDVELAGEIRDSGFAERQWLVRRGDRYLQLTELLYRIVEHADGRTVEELAQAVSEATEWIVEPDQVRKLLAGRLMPLGLIETVEGGTLQLPGMPTAADPAARRGGPSPLSVNLRARLVGAAALERVASILQYLFAPVLLIPMFVVAAGAHLWLYTERGLMDAFIQTLYTPGALLVLLVLIVAAGLFHELGHASALRYGGGRARSIGVGVYLMFPVFYTDVTESYRLGRWARVRTGLGGIYFHLVFAVALIGAAVVLGLEFLLLAVLLINIEAIRQLVPFGRFDGYWVLADLTGVPDFYSQMPAFVRSVARRDARGSKLPRLKRWPKVAFAAYAVATVPVLGLVVYFLVDRLPGFISVTWNAIGTQAEFLEHGVRTDDYIVAATALGQLLVLLASGLAIVYFLGLLVYAPVRASLRQRRARAVVGLSATAAAAGIVAFFWFPQLPFVGTAGPAGVEKVEVSSRDHVRGPIHYADAPPAGGDHAQVWQNCGFYSGAIRTENAVHSLEHGAVWITFRPDLAAEEVARLRRIAASEYVLVSALPVQSEPVIATAWGRRLRLRSAFDTRLDRFIDAFRLHSTAPEPGEPCTGGRGTPE